MIRWYLSVKNLLKAIEKKANDALPLYESGGKEASASIKGYMEIDFQQLLDLWHERYPDENLVKLRRHISFGMAGDYSDIINRDLPEIEMQADAYLLASEGHVADTPHVGFEDLLHPVVVEHSYQLYRDGHLREAVLNSVTAVFDCIRARTGSKEDGDRLIGQVMGLSERKIGVRKIGVSVKILVVAMMLGAKCQPY